MADPGNNIILGGISINNRKNNRGYWVTISPGDNQLAMHGGLFLGPTQCLDPGNNTLSHHALSPLATMPPFSQLKIHKIIRSLGVASRLKSDAIN